MATDRLLIEGEEVELGEAVVALSLQSNDITKPESIQANFSNTIQLPDTHKLRALLEYADQVNSTTNVPYRVLDAQVFKEGVEVVPFGKGHLLNGSYEIDIYSGNRNFFDALGDKNLRELDLSAYNHYWTFVNIRDNSENTDWQQGFVYDLYDRGKSINLTAIDCYEFIPSVFVRRVWEQIFTEAGFTYTGFSLPIFDKLLLPTAELFEYDEDYRKAREFKVTTNAGNKSKIEEFEEKMPFNFVNLDYFTDPNGGYNLNNSTYTVDAARNMSFYAGVKTKINTTSGPLSGIVRAQIEIRINGAVVKFENFSNEGHNDVNRYLTVDSGPVTVFAGDVVEVWFKFIHQTNTVVDPDCVIFYEDTKEPPVFRATVLPEFPKKGLVELAKWLPDLSQKDFIKSIVQLFGLTFQTELFEDSIKVNTFSKVLENIPNAIDISSWVHNPENVRPSFKFGDFAQRNTIIWQEDDTVTENYNNGAILIADTTLEAEKNIIELPYAATEIKNGLLSIPMYTAKVNTNPVEYDYEGVEPRLVIQGPDTITFTIVEFNGTDIIKSHEAARPLAYFVDSSKPYDLNIQDYIIPTFYPTLLAILENTKVLTVQVKTPAKFIQEFDQSVPVWIEYFQHYFYVNKINEFVNSYSLTEWELVRI